MRVLIVDDEELVRNALVRGLRHLGHDAIAVGDGAEALSVAEQYRPDLCVVDLIMPKKDGLATIAELRERLPHTPCVLLTGTPEAVAESPGIPVLSKPLRLAELRGLIARYDPALPCGNGEGGQQAGR